MQSEQSGINQGQHSETDWAQVICAVAFDMDGLMVNTEDLYTIVSQIILKRRGREFTSDLKNAMMGLPAQQAFEKMIAWEQLDDSVETLAKETEEEFEAILSSRLELLPGVTELLDELDSHGLPRCVATSSTERFAERVLSTVGIRERFDFVITAEHVENGKPAPDIYIAAAKRMGVETTQMMVLEDSQHGCSAGIAAGACTVAVPGDHSREHDFTGVHAIANQLTDKLIYSIVSASR